MSRWLNSSRNHFGVMLIIPVSGKPHTDCLCVVCLRGEDLVLLLSVRLAPIANFNNYEFFSVITDNQLIN